MELWPDAVQDHTHWSLPSITIRSPDWKETKVFFTPTSISSWEQHGKLQDSQGIAEKTAQYVRHIQDGLRTRTACICQGSAWKYVENCHNQPASI